MKRPPAQTTIRSPPLRRDAVEPGAERVWASTTGLGRLHVWRSRLRAAPEHVHWFRPWLGRFVPAHDELSIARRLEWIRRGLYGSEKGAEKLQKGLASAGPQTNYDLNVEIKQSGGAKIVSPSTNAPAGSCACAPAANTQCK